MQTKQTPMINRAFELSEQRRANDSIRLLAIDREEALRYEASVRWELQEARQKIVKTRQQALKARQQGFKKGFKQGLEQARQEGRQEGQQDLVKQLLASGRLTIAELAQATGLSLAELHELSK